jgi:hypothetical protein
MILNELEIKNIINKEPKKLKNSLSGDIVNSYEYTLEEQLNLIQTYIKERKGVDTGNISPPRGEMCVTFMQLAINHGIHPMSAMEKSSDLHAASFLMDCALRFYNNKYAEKKENL